jgi:hypothetical protein
LETNDVETDRSNRGGGGAVHLNPARLKCTFRTFDVVTSLELRAFVAAVEGASASSASSASTKGKSVSSVAAGTAFRLELELAAAECDFRVELNLDGIDMEVQHSECGARHNPIACDRFGNMKDFLESAEVLRVQDQVSGRLDCI